MSKFTDLQRAFAEIYLANGFKGTQAARDAGYKGNAVTLASVAYENLRKPHIAALVEARIKELAMGADEALARLSEQARADMSDFIDPASNSIDLLKAEEAGKLHLIKKFTHTVGKETEHFGIELYDAQSALLNILKEQHLLKGEATEITDDASLTNEKRVDRLIALLDVARARRDGRAAGGGGSDAAGGE